MFIWKTNHQYTSNLPHDWQHFVIICFVSDGKVLKVLLVEDLRWTHSSERGGNIGTQVQEPCIQHSAVLIVEMANGLRPHP